MATLQSNPNFFALLNDLDDDVSKVLEKEKDDAKANGKGKDSSRPSTADKKEKKGQNVRTKNGRGSGSGCKSPVSARSNVKEKDCKVIGNKKQDNERGAKAQTVNANWKMYGKGQKLNERGNNGTSNKDHTINGGRSYNNGHVDKRHKSNFPGRGIVLGCGVVKDTGNDHPKSNGQEAGFDGKIVKSHINQSQSGIAVVEGMGDDKSNGQEAGSEENWTEIKSQKNRRKSSKVNCKAVVKGTIDDHSNGPEEFFDEEWTEIMSHKNQRKYDHSNGQGEDFDEMWEKIIESHKIQRKPSDGNWDLYGRGRRLNEDADYDNSNRENWDSGYATGNHWDLCGKGRRLNE